MMYKEQHVHNLARMHTHAQITQGCNPTHRHCRLPKLTLQRAHQIRYPATSSHSPTPHPLARTPWHRHSFALVHSRDTCLHLGTYVHTCVCTHTRTQYRTRASQHPPNPPPTHPRPHPPSRRPSPHLPSGIPWHRHSFTLVHTLLGNFP